MTNRRISFLSVSIALILAVQTTYGMGQVREWVDKLTNQPPVVVTNTPPTPVPPPVVTNTPPTPPPATGPTLVKVYAQKHQVIGFKVTGLDGWPSRVEDGKTLIGIMRCNGKKFDWVSTANAAGGGKVVHNLYGAKYGQSIKKGQTVMIDITDINGKRPTNQLPFVWPWEDTNR